jgi:SEL1 protein
VLLLTDQGDREALNGLGIIYRDGILVNVDKQKAYQYFQAAAGQDLAEAQVNLAKLHLGECGVAYGFPAPSL